MPGKPKSRCPCNCGGMLTAETIHIHLQRRHAQVQAPNGGRQGNNEGRGNNGNRDLEPIADNAMPFEMGINNHNEQPANMVPPPAPIAPEANPAYAPAIGGEENGDLGGLGLGMDVDLDDQPPPLIPHAIRRNPAVTIEDWPDPFWEPEFESGESDVDDGPIGDFERDPDYIEHREPPQFDPLDEPELNDQELRELVEAEIGNLADGEWMDMYTRTISTQDNHTLRLLATRLRTHFSRSTYEDLRHGVCETLNIPSECVAWRRLRILSKLETRTYDCCVNSCVCFLGKYKDRQTCPYCGEDRLGPNGKRRRAFRYSPLIPQLLGLFQNPTMAQKMRYRADVEHEDQQANEVPPGGGGDEQEQEPMIQDVFDGEHYRMLRETQVNPDRNYCFFDNPEDIALGLSTDGFTLFKRKRRGLSTAWPIILINYNLHPRIRTRLENVICVGVIPGPSQPKDLNSFLIPLLEELLELEDGVEASGLRPDGTGYDFVLHAFLIIIFGDIPAIAKLLMMKGHNAFSPCRACFIEGVLCKLTRNSIYYVPLMAPRQTQVWECHDLPMRTHEYFLAHYDELDRAATQGERDQIARHWGVNGEPVFARLKSVDLSMIAPYDIMHLLFENLVPNLIKLWTGKFKGLGQGNGSFQLSKAQWDAVGRLTANAARTIPSAFVGTLPDIAQDGSLYKAEAHSFWIQFVAPIVLKGRLPEKYYKHLLLLREVIARCLQMKITMAAVDELEELIQKWVTEYERYYYQYKQSRLPACPITIHALLHMPYYLRQTGPLWASWAFVMERFCGHLLPAVKNRTRPYDHLDNYIQHRAQMQIVSNVFNLPSLSRPMVNYRIEQGVEISSHETVYPEFPLIVLGRPQVQLKGADLTNSLMAKFTHYFGMANGIHQAALVRARIDTNSIIRYGRFRMAGDGDSIRTAKQVTKDSSARDNSYVRYILVPDANAAFRNRPDVPVRQTQYGRLLDIFHVMFKEDNGVYTRHLLAHLEPCDTRGLDASVPYSAPVKYSRMLGSKLAHIDTIEAVIGRIELEGGWAIIDPSREAMRTRFINEDGNELD